MKILYVTTISNTINQFLVPHIKMLIEKGNQVDLACNVYAPIHPDLVELGCRVYHISFERSPLSRQNLNAYRAIKQLLTKNHYDLVHTHTPVASAIVRLVCKKIKATHVYYTAHGFHFYKGAPLLNWLIYYTIEKYLAKFTDTIITINQEDYHRACKKFKAKRIVYLPGVGFDIERFKKTIIDRQEKRREIGIPQEAFLVLSVGELNHNKNHETIIRAVAKLNNPKIHYCICGRGEKHDALLSLAKKLKIENQVHLLGQRRDIAEICKCSDLFAFPSYREGLGIAALEAMAAGLPLITSNVHGIVDYAIAGKSAILCRPEDVEAFALGIDYLYQHPEVCAAYGQFNQEHVDRYDLQHVLIQLNEIYNGIIL